MNLPNKLTVLRIFMIPIFMIVVLGSFDWGQVTWLGSTIEITQLVGAIIFAVASITDWLDGKIARARGLVTNFGKFADPLADKMLVVTAFIVLVGQGVVPSWVVTIIIFRELAVTGLRLLLVGDGEVMSAAMPGKIKTATQMIAIILLLLNNFPFAGMNFPFAMIMLYICLFFTVYSGIDYFVKNKHVFSGPM
ncbi:CDP-diacylglycerol--glycerol-3-phosphate 3-phosphatidyltransferase [Carnobacterium maltaromaticum]|uniref:CDP-diacylglycerol--glycerol-3-phosphate 3-phosphatidyltransferase n=1 Tax=Carnobacterium maltaromaticum TaxID=2751 RepID=UPI000C77EB88|nr:CDP-diacylglycerol--glycerol-3-phosphate 3-phosphatidyltransferase [Carnobacterium maltaromaticum]PLS34760.1 CDP-diacylglycerol--glycerol-3-phosphate 3-phosphatidyltransferase [Carnobacterium maltaromaticum]PLS36579.1 CDP-diacylglycerol--glycerol-3-phosphate 3-phosphatidyltransferase [Carnobacterium maltaromaticum]PLS37394.1 CDP-diacylglycerol--glycerol-3-phosphate 3-phosphatidyltransferase [Carnobacterium maltaromaticum]PLS43610.1 CDP-diacylglycerol--glycerol-3-phosphate 3-phosphatidyltrans